MKWIIETGSERWVVDADGPKQAIIAAFKERAPQNAGGLTQATNEYGHEFWSGTTTCLLAAGYNVRVKP